MILISENLGKAVSTVDSRGVLRFEQGSVGDRRGKKKRSPCEGRGVFFRQKLLMRDPNKSLAGVVDHSQCLGGVSLPASGSDRHTALPSLRMY